MLHNTTSSRRTSDLANELSNHQAVTCYVIHHLDSIDYISKGIPTLSWAGTLRIVIRIESTLGHSHCLIPIET
jgi:hypothetical protein